MSHCIRLSVLIAAMLLVGCASITPLKSKPPYSKITVNKPFKWGDGIFLIRLDYPTGTYLPLYEDDDGYYYQAPQKITGRDSWMPLLIDGGLFLERGKQRPDHVYFIRSNLGVPGKVKIGDRADVTMTP
jgi:hypothetical protein